MVLHHTPVRRRPGRLLPLPQPVLPAHPAAGPAVQHLPAGPGLGDQAAGPGRHRARGPRGRRRHRAPAHRGSHRLRPRDLRLRPGPAGHRGRRTCSIAPGETVAFVGPTGAGKSTLAKLVTRFYDPTAGRVLIDGHDLREVTMYSLRSPARRGAPGALPVRRDHRGQHRLRPARPPPTRRSTRPSTGWGSRDVIDRMPDGLDTVVHERGQTLSSGERQLIALARAFLAHPRVLVLDEATSNLDLQSETKIEVGPRRPAREPHGHPHRPPAVHGHAGRPHRGGRRGPDRRGRAPTTSWWPGAAATPRCTPPGSARATLAEHDATGMPAA